MATSRSFGARSLITRSPMRISPLVDCFQTGDQAQQRRFAASRRSDQHDEFSVIDVEIDAAQNLGVAVGLAQVANANGGHVSPSRRRR